MSATAEPLVKIPLTKQEVLAAIHEAQVEGKAASGEGWQGFNGKVSRKGAPGNSAVEYVCAYRQASWDQLLNVEAWLKPLAGGGTYQIFVYLEAGAGWTFTTDGIPGPSKRVDSNLALSAAWIGPTIYASEAALEGQGGGGTTTASSPHNDGRPATSSPLPDIFAETERRRADAERAERRAEEAERRRREELREERLMKVLELSRQPPPALPAPTPGPDLMTIIGSVIGAVTPLAKLLLDNQQKAAERSEVLRKEEAEHARAVLERQSKSAEEQTKQFLSMFEVQAKSAAANIELQSTMQRAMAQQFASLTELRMAGAPEDDFSWKELLKAGIAGLATAAQQRPQPQAQGPGPAVVQQQIPAPAPVEIPESEAMNRVEERIRARQENLEQIAAEFLNAVTSDEDAKREIQAAGGLQQMVTERMNDFLTDAANQEYTAKLWQEVVKQAQARNISL